MLACSTKKKCRHQSTAVSTWWCGPRPRLNWVEMAVGLPEGPSYSEHSPSFFRYTTAEEQHTASSKSVACFLFCPSLAHLRLPILLLLMSGNVHPNPGSIFPCSVCAGNVTWRGKSVQWCTCFKWVHLKCSQLFLFKFRTLQLPLLQLPPCRKTVTPSSDMYTSTVQSGPPLLVLHFRPTLVPKPLIPHLPILYLLLPPHHRPLLLAVLLRLVPPLLPLTFSEFSNGMLEVFEPGALNYFTFSCPILSTFSASRNPILTHLPLYGFSALRSDRTHSRSGILCRDVTHASGGVSSFLSGRAYLSLNFLPPLFLRLISTLIM